MKRVLVTGAGTGLGKLMSIALAKKGYKVIATVYSLEHVDSLNKVALENDIEFTIEKLDISDAYDREKAFEWDVDVLINNAGIAETGPLAEIPMEYFRRNFEVNVFSTLALTQGIVQGMVKRGIEGKVIFISSIAGIITKPLTGPYCATKHALEAIAEVMHEELKDYNIQISLVNPGPYDTGFNDAQMKEMKKWYDSEKNFTHLTEDSFKFPLEQYQPDELIERVVKIVSGESNLFRNLLPEKFIDVVKDYQSDLWVKQI
ncbi:short-chain dehydrogenase/reductase [Acinetobacter sp. TGL-Y2]|uniref:SDR family oxidoreductase n=1 Tax=Acinetobacter sp. TGL-Y2 TaxID=1407071 RepID=UPI0007A67BF6|nr:SDR family oxidoreductase [Acinetobacter sp. TGL-Y2]AMW79427.1 short-chain dehydrogenase/reductase [Acinetobacter sp. TGL-Y2]